MSQNIFGITSFEDCNKIIRIEYTIKLFFEWSCRAFINLFDIKIKKLLFIFAKIISKNVF